MGRVIVLRGWLLGREGWFEHFSFLFGGKGCLGTGFAFGKVLFWMESFETTSMNIPSIFFPTSYCRIYMCIRMEFSA